MCVGVRGQLVWAGSFLLPCGSWELNSRVTRLGSKHLCLLNHLTGPKLLDFLLYRWGMNVKLFSQMDSRWCCNLFFIWWQKGICSSLPFTVISFPVNEGWVKCPSLILLRQVLYWNAKHLLCPRSLQSILCILLLLLFLPQPPMNQLIPRMNSTIHMPTLGLEGMSPQWRSPIV